MVGLAGFEPTTSCTPSNKDTHLWPQLVDSTLRCPAYRGLFMRYRASIAGVIEGVVSKPKTFPGRPTSIRFRTHSAWIGKGLCACTSPEVHADVAGVGSATTGKSSDFFGAPLQRWNQNRKAGSCAREGQRPLVSSSAFTTWPNPVFSLAFCSST